MDAPEKLPGPSSKEPEQKRNGSIFAWVLEMNSENMAFLFLQHFPCYNPELLRLRESGGMVDAPDLGSGEVTRGGSSPPSRTILTSVKTVDKISHF